MSAVLKLLKLRMTSKSITIQIERLKPKALIELRKAGFSYDAACAILGMGKVTAIKEMKKRSQ
jgi:hypothetical protein